MAREVACEAENERAWVTSPPEGSARVALWVEICRSARGETASAAGCVITNSPAKISPDRTPRVSLIAVTGVLEQARTGSSQTLIRCPRCASAQAGGRPRAPRVGARWTTHAGAYVRGMTLRAVLFSTSVAGAAIASTFSCSARRTTRLSPVQITIYNELAWLTHGDDRERVSKRLANTLAGARPRPAVRRVRSGRGQPCNAPVVRAHSLQSAYVTRSTTSTPKSRCC